MARKVTTIGLASHYNHAILTVDCNEVVAESENDTEF